MTNEARVIDPQRVQRLSEAADWLLRLQDSERTEEDYTDWLRWCDADPQNLAAYETVQHKWHQLDALKEGGGIVAAHAYQASKLDINLTEEQKQDLLHEQTKLSGAGFTTAVASRRPVATRVGWAIAASIAIAAAVLAFVPGLHTFDSRPARQVASALTNRATTLPDGSRMILGAKSRVNVDFNGPQRALDLSSGEAYFKVKHDKTRPFVVQAGEVSVTAVGTAFDVRRGADKVTITVEEGIVDVSSQGPDGKPTVWRAEAGYQVTYSLGQRTASIAGVNPSTELAWRNGELAYIYEPLSTVVEDLNRYSSSRIVIADPQVAQIPFTGTAFVTSLHGWLAGIEQAHPVTVTHTAGGDIVLSSRR